jgi:hypothetical protein
MEWKGGAEGGRDDEGRLRVVRAQGDTHAVPGVRRECGRVVAWPVETVRRAGQGTEGFRELRHI